MPKVRWLAGIILLLAFGAAGCGSNNEANDSASTPTSPTSAFDATSVVAPAADEVTVSAGTTILAGNVESSTGEPLSGATITVLDGPDAGLTATTNADGDYEFRTLTGGNANFSATAAGHAESRAGISSDSSVTLNFVLTRTHTTLTGTVSNTSGQRIGGATVTVLDGPDTGKSATADSNGVYKFDLIIIGNANFAATASLYSEDRRGVHVNGTNTLNFTLEVGKVALTGYAQDRNEVRLAEVTIKVLDGPNQNDAVTTDSDGNYTFSSLTVGNANFSATKEGYTGDDRGVYLNGTNTLNFTLTKIDGGETTTTTIEITGAVVTATEWKFVVTAGHDNYKFDFGDGNSADDTHNEQQHLYRTRGSYTVTCEVTKSDGEKVTVELKIDVT